MATKTAVVVGIDKYDTWRWRELSCCTNDATQVAHILKMPEYGFKVNLLLDKEATKTEILRALMEARKANPELLLFYFAGHGASTELDASIVTFDNEEYTEGIELPKLATIVSSADCGSSVTILDCCHAGAATYRGPGGGRGVLRGEDVQRVYSGLDSSRAILAACGERESALEEQNMGHGIFTYYLLEGLMGEAADYQGNISVHSLYDFVSRPFADRPREQTPVFRGDVSGRLVLGRGFPPRLGAPLEEDVAKTVEDEAESFLETYAKKLAEYQYAEWRTKGYDAACRALTPINKWFDKQLTQTPSLIRRPRFSRLYESLLSRKISLGAIDPGTTVQEGVLERIIGSGGFGTVWHVESVDGSPDKAYKVYHPHDVRDLEKTSRFRTGYEAMAMLAHDHIVRVHRFTDCPLGFVMDYIPGQNLRDFDPSSALRDPRDQIKLLLEIADTVDHAHGKGVIHRDIKPENIIITYDNNGGVVPYLTDFDLAWFSTQTQRATKTALGVVYYAAPEQHVAFDARKAQGKRRTLDVYSFGQLAHFIVTGLDPEPVNKQLNKERIAKRLQQWTTSEAVVQFSELYDKATQWDPEDRYQDFAMIMSKLRDIRDEMTHTTLDRKLTNHQFRNEVVFQVSGRPVPDTANDNPSVSFTTASGNWSVTLTCRERSLGRKRDALILENRFTPNERVGLPNISNEKMRAVLNSRVDGELYGPVTARRRAGKQGTYEVFVDFEILDRNLRRVQQVRDMLARVISALER